MTNRLEWIGTIVLDKVYESKDITASSETTKDYVIPDGETWYIMRFGASSTDDDTEVDLLYSGDAGVSWANPYDDSSDIIKCIMLNAGGVSYVLFENPICFKGSGTDVILRFKAKNNNSDVSVNEVTCWINGWIE